jgi:hypothetical protein
VPTYSYGLLWPPPEAAGFLAPFHISELVDRPTAGRTLHGSRREAFRGAVQVAGVLKHSLQGRKLARVNTQDGPAAQAASLHCPRAAHPLRVGGVAVAG